MNFSWKLCLATKSWICMAISPLNSISGNREQFRTTPKLILSLANKQTENFFFNTSIVPLPTKRSVVLLPVCWGKYEVLASASQWSTCSLLSVHFSSRYLIFLQRMYIFVCLCFVQPIWFFPELVRASGHALPLLFHQSKSLFRLSKTSCIFYWNNSSA